jgi:hypothetical protein
MAVDVEGVSWRSRILWVAELLRLRLSMLLGKLEYSLGRYEGHLRKFCLRRRAA